MRPLVLFLVVGMAAVASAEQAPAPTTTRAILLDDNKPTANCGGFEVWSILHFDASADAKAPRGTKIDPKRLAVAVPCAEMKRSTYSKTAGNAGVLVKGKAYVLTLTSPRADDRWGKTYAFEAKRIDDAP